MGTHVNSLKSLAEPVAHVRYAGRSLDVPLAALDVGTMPYPPAGELPTGFAQAMSPLKLFEYMAAGVPIVASDLPALREILSDGNNALLTPPGDPQALATAIRSLLESPARREAIARRARSDVAGHSWETRARRALEFAGLKTS